MGKIYLPKPTRKTVWAQLIIYFILVALITLMCSSYFLYSYFSASFKEEIIELNDKILNQMSMVSDEFILRNVNELSLNIAMYYSLEPNLKNFFVSSDQNSWADILNTRNTLNNLVFQNRNVVESIYAYSKSKDMCISQRIVKFINKDLSNLPDALDWISEINSQNESIIYIKTRNIPIYTDSMKKRDNIITIVCTYPLSSSPNNAKGYIAVNIREEALNDYLVKFNSTKLGHLLIIDDSGAIISHSDKTKLYDDISNEDFIQKIISNKEPMHFETTFNDTDYFVAYTTAKYNNWYYVSMIPTSLLYQKNYFIKRRTLISCGIILAIALALSSLFSHRIYSPLKNLLNKYTKNLNNSIVNNVNEYQLLDYVFNDISVKVSDLQETLDKNMSMIQHNFLRDLLCKEHNTLIDVEDSLSELNINFPNEYFAVATLTFDNSVIDSHPQTNIQSYKYNIIDFIKNLNHENHTVYPVDIDTLSISIIMNSGKNNMEFIKYFIDTIEIYCYSNFSFYLIAGIGTMVNSIYSLNQSYIDSKRAMNYKFIYPKQNIFYFDDIALKNIDAGNIPLEYIDKFDKFLRLENKKEIEAVLDALYSIIFEDNIPYEETKKLTMTLTELYRHFLSDINICFEDLVDEKYRKKLLEPQTVDTFFTTLSIVLNKTFMYIEDQKLNRNYQLICTIEEYINNNIYSDISLNCVADNFNITSQYLSRIFKEEKGINYIDYITNCKIDEAKRLLTTTDLTIAEISAKLGYSHATYFSRKFKEITGNSPSKYRSEQNKRKVAST